MEQARDVLRLYFGSLGKKLSDLNQTSPNTYEALIEKKNGEVEMWMCDTSAQTFTKIE